jgi:hypothetical protein
MSFINSYDEIKAQIEERIDNIDGLSATDAALVAAAAQLLNGRNQSIANMQELLTYLQNRQDGVDDDTTIKDIVLLLGASMGSKNVVWRMREFLIDGTFTVPNNIAGGVVYVSGSGGGGSGAARIFNATGGRDLSGASSGCYVSKRPVTASAGEPIAVTVGAGGASVSVTGAATAFSAGNDGLASSFGALVIPGGAGAAISASDFSNPRGGWIGGFLNGTQFILAENSTAYRAGRRSFSGSVSAEGSAAGAFGDGQDSVSTTNANATASSAAANSGAGGGSAAVSFSSGTLTATSGAGGSGRIIVEWQEFV